MAQPERKSRCVPEGRRVRAAPRPGSARIAVALGCDVGLGLWDAFVIWELAPGAVLAALSEKGVA